MVILLGRIELVVALNRSNEILPRLWVVRDYLVTRLQHFSEFVNHRNCITDFPLCSSACSAKYRLWISSCEVSLVMSPISFQPMATKLPSRNSSNRYPPSP